VRAVQAWRQRGSDQAAPYTILAVWLLGSLAVVALQGAALEPHYLVILYPAGFLAMALVVDWVWRALSVPASGRHAWARCLRAVVGAGVLTLVAWQGYMVLYLYDFVARADTTGGYGVPLSYWRQVADLAKGEAAAAGVDEVWVITQGADISFEETPVILHYLLEPDVHPVFLGQGGNEALLLPVGRPAVYLITRPLPAALDAALVRLGGQERGSVSSPDGGTARAVAVPACSEAEAMSLVPRRVAAVDLDSGLTLLGYDAPAAARAGDTITLTTYWAFRSVPVNEQGVGHSLFNHLLDAAGEKVAQRDGFGLPERYWREGRVLVQWFELPLPGDMPAGDYTLLTGMYRLSDFTRNRVLDQGDAVEDAVPLGSIHVGP